MATIISGSTGVSQCAPNSVSQDDLQTGVTSKGPVFRAQQAASQTASTGVQAKVALANETYDSANCYDVANSRYTPNVAGYYRFSGVVRGSGTTVNQFFVYLFKNGLQLSTAGGSFTATTQHVNIGDIVYMNGTTDFIELWAQMTGTGLSFERTNDAVCANFCGELVRAA